VQAHTQPTATSSVLDIDNEGFNAIGRAVHAAHSQDGYSKVVKEITRMIEYAGDHPDDIDTRYTEIWAQSGGAEFFAAALDDPYGCDVRSYLSETACFAYIYFATHIPLPGTPGSGEFNEALYRI
jgi:hypothetical protein